MITTKLEGGLGNQMFQYAAAKSLALQLNCQIHLDVSAFYKRKIHNGFELDKFALHQNIVKIEDASTHDIIEKIGRTWFGQTLILRYLLGKIYDLKSGYYVEKSFSFDSDLFNQKCQTTIKGYWQSYKYFESIRQELLEDFRFLVPPSEMNQALVKKITSQNAVSLHVRRGDYVANAHTNSYHGVCGLDYYQRAVSEIEHVLTDPVYFIFSDDPQWTFENLKISSDATYVTHNTGVNSYLDLYLMSLCKHNVIANSSFSWWGAWLNQNPSKIVIAPHKWFAIEKDTSDLVPPAWIKL